MRRRRPWWIYPGCAYAIWISLAQFGSWSTFNSWVAGFLALAMFNAWHASRSR